MIFDKNAKNLGILGIGLTKLTVLAAALFIITMWAPVLTLVQKVNPWMYLAIAILAAIMPMYKFFKSNDAGKAEVKAEIKPAAETEVAAA